MPSPPAVSASPPGCATATANPLASRVDPEVDAWWNAWAARDAAPEVAARRRLMTAVQIGVVMIAGVVVMFLAR